MSLIQNQLDKEKKAIKKVWGITTSLFAWYWGIIGIFCLFTPAFPVGIIFILGAWYIIARKKGKTQ